MKNPLGIWLAVLAMGYKMLHKRLNYLGYSPEDAISRPKPRRYLS